MINITNKIYRKVRNNRAKIMEREDWGERKRNGE
jgi:hypothetical protein